MPRESVDYCVPQNPPIRSANIPSLHRPGVAERPVFSPRPRFCVRQENAKVDRVKEEAHSVRRRFGKSLRLLLEGRTLAISCSWPPFLVSITFSPVENAIQHRTEGRSRTQNRRATETKTFSGDHVSGFSSNNRATIAEARYARTRAITPPLK